MKCNGDCNGINKPSRVKAICRVCELVDGDRTHKPVWFCDTCEVYICKDCWYSPKRAIALILHAVEKAWKKISV